MINVVIIEDEPIIARHLKNQLKELNSEIQVAKVLESVSDSLEYFNNNTLPDLIFSDIQLTDGLSFEIFETLNIQCPVIFLTAYDEYAIKAFKLNSIHYLLKPVTKNELKYAIDKYLRFYSKSPIYSQNVSKLLEDLSDDQKKFKTRFLAHHLNTIIPISEQQILYFKKDQFIFIVTSDNNEHLTDYTSLEELQELLNPDLFFRVNRQYIAHIQSIKNYKSIAFGKLLVALKGNIPLEIVVSKEKAPYFKNWLKQNNF